MYIVPVRVQQSYGRVRSRTVPLPWGTAGYGRQRLSQFRRVPHNKGLETLKKFEPLNGVIFSSPTHVLLNFGQTAILYMEKMFCTMWGYYHQRGETRTSEDCLKIIVLEVGGLIVFQLRNIYTIKPDLPFRKHPDLFCFQ